MSYDLKEIRTHFFEDPRWKGVEEIIKEFIDPLLDMNTIDTTKDAEDVKAQVIGRIHAYETLSEFLRQSGIIGGHKREEITKSPFR